MSDMVLNKFDCDFWKTIDELIDCSKVIIDRPKGSHHRRYPDIVYKVDYGYLDNTTSMDGGGIDVWRGTKDEHVVDAIICIVDLYKKDSEIKLLIGCTDEEKELIYTFHNEHETMKGILINRNLKQEETQ